VRAAVLRYRVMAYVTGVVLIVLCFVGIPLQVFAHNTAVVNYVGTTHGILYLIYLVTAYHLSRLLGMKLGSPQTVILLLAGTIPVLTFVVERWMTRRYIDPALAAAEASEAGRPPAAPPRAATTPQSPATPPASTTPQSR
jgi:integral membrane protein